MPFCSSCGQQLEDGDSFCTSCGAVRESGSTTTPGLPDPAEIRWTNTIFGMTLDFFVNGEGAGQEASKAVSNLNTGITVAGALLGSMTAAGAGLIAKGRENDSIRWDDARKVALNERKKTVTVTRKSLIFPIRLYCTDDNYPQVVSFIRRHIDPTLIHE